MAHMTGLQGDAHPRVTDMIFHPPADPLNASAEDIVDAALGYRAIVV